MTESISKDQSPQKSDTQIHYEELRKFFEKILGWTLIALSIIIAAGGFFFYSNISGFRSDMNTAIGNISNNANVAIDRTRDSAQQSITAIRNEASKLAISEAHSRVNEAFKQTNIKTMIDAVAKEELTQTIQQRIAEEVDRITPKMESNLTEAGNVADMAMRMRIGLRSGLTDLRKIQSTSNSETIRQLAARLYSRILIDYESTSAIFMNEYGFQDISNIKKFYNIPPNASDSLFRSNIVQTIENDDIDLSQVALNFQILRKLTGVKFNMFDFAAVQDWSKKQGLK